MTRAKANKTSDAAKPKEPKRIVELTNEQRLEFYNLSLRRQILMSQFRENIGHIDIAEAMFIDKMNEIYDVDLRNYKLDQNSGQCVYTGPQEAPVE